MSKSQNISLIGGIALAIGSIMGSGILFLPTLTAKLSGPAVFWVWIASLLMCIPLAYIFFDIVKLNVGPGSLEKIIESGLGKRISIALPLLFLGTVSFGMPTAAFIVGKYVSAAFSGTHLMQFCVTILIIIIGSTVNLFGIKSSQHIQTILAILMFAITIALFALTMHKAIPHYPTYLTPKHVHWINWGVLSAVVVCFWAYAGFENLTFMSGEFKNVQKHFCLSIIIGLLLCGIVYALLALNYASLISAHNMNVELGLFQLSKTTHYAILPYALSAFAFVAVQLNFNSWIWGISRLIQNAGKTGLLPNFLSKQTKEIPKRAITLLTIIFIVVSIGLYFHPKLVHILLILVSTNFVFIYILCLSSYILTKKRLSLLTLFAAGLLVLLISSISSSGWLILYPIALVLLSNLALLISRFIQNLNTTKIN